MKPAQFADSATEGKKIHSSFVFTGLRFRDFRTRVVIKISGCGKVSNDTTAFSSTTRFRRVPLRNTSPRFNAFTNSGPKADPSILSQCLLGMDFRGAAGGNHRRRIWPETWGRDFTTKRLTNS